MKNILDLFIKIEDDSPKKADVKTTSEKPVASPVQATAPSTVSSVGQIDPEIKNQLAEALEKANLDGYEYFEFARSVDAQANLIPAEALRFQSTFAVATSMGLSVDKLLSSAQYYLDILDKKRSEFGKTLATHTDNTVTSKEVSISKLDAEVQAKAQEIQKITQEIALMQQQRAALTNQLSTAQVEIERVRNNFDATLHIFTSRILSDIDKIKSYLIGGK